MRLKHSELAASAVKKTQYPEERLPQIALFGRSNAGKSSLINTLIERKNLARTSSAPGKTRLLNFYRIEAASDDDQPLQWYFVDLPGYGYAKVAKSERDNWLRIIEEYLRWQAPKLCWQLVDIRHQPSAQDIAMYDILRDNGFEVVLIANKADKLSKNQRQKALSVIAKTMGAPREEIFVFSAITREGKEQLQNLVADYLQRQQPAMSGQQSLDDK